MLVIGSNVYYLRIPCYERHSNVDGVNGLAKKKKSIQDDNLDRGCKTCKNLFHRVLLHIVLFLNLKLRCGDSYNNSNDHNNSKPELQVPITAQGRDLPTEEKTIPAKS